MIDELVRRMESSSRALEFERAARYRDQIANLRTVQARQYVSGPKGNADVVAARAREGVAVVELFVIRNGQSLGSRTMRLAHGGDASESELLHAFLPQHYPLALRARTADSGRNSAQSYPPGTRDAGTSHW